MAYHPWPIALGFPAPTGIASSFLLSLFCWRQRIIGGRHGGGKDMDGYQPLNSAALVLLREPCDTRQAVVPGFVLND